VPRSNRAGQCQKTSAPPPHAIAAVIFGKICGPIRGRIIGRHKSNPKSDRLLEVDPGGAAAAASEQNYAAWKERRQVLLSRASQPSISVQTVTALAGLEASKHLRACPPVQVERMARDDVDRPGSLRTRSTMSGLSKAANDESSPIGTPSRTAFLANEISSVRRVRRVDALHLRDRRGDRALGAQSRRQVGIVASHGQK
jgi:hypothetical protein